MDEQHGGAVRVPQTPGTAALFPLGRLLATPGALALLEDSGVTVFHLVTRHLAGDWGELDKADRDENWLSVRQGFRVFSSYEVRGVQRIWVITEADRSVTTLLLPSEY